MNERSTRFEIKQEPGQRMGHLEKLTDRTKKIKRNELAEPRNVLVSVG